MSVVLKETQGGTKFKYKGICDFDGMMNYAFKWFRDRGFEFNEKKHKHKMGCPKGFEIERDVEAWRKIDDFIKYHIKISLHAWDAYQVEAIKDGKKVKLWNMRFELETSFKVEYDYANKWEKSPWMEKLRDNFYTQYIIKKDLIVNHADPLYYKSLELHTNLKKFVGMTATHYR